MLKPRIDDLAKKHKNFKVGPAAKQYRHQRVLYCGLLTHDPPTLKRAMEGVFSAEKGASSFWGKQFLGKT